MNWRITYLITLCSELVQPCWLSISVCSGLNCHPKGRSMSLLQRSLKLGPAFKSIVIIIRSSEFTTSFTWGMLILLHSKCSRRLILPLTASRYWTHCMMSSWALSASISGRRLIWTRWKSLIILTTRMIDTKKWRRWSKTQKRPSWPDSTKLIQL